MMTIISAQDKWSVEAEAGVIVPTLNSGTGLTLSLNPTYEVSNAITLEGQLSYYGSKGEAFLSGKRRKHTAVSTLVGSRLYFNKSERTKRFYMKLLLGFAQSKLEKEDTEDSGINGALVLGGFYEFNKKWHIGASVDTNGETYFALKCGVRLF